jgi:hypothetical protein
MKRKIWSLLCSVLLVGCLPLLANAQENSKSGSLSLGSYSAARATQESQPNVTYVRPSEKTKFHNYLFDAIGPYPILGAAVVAGVNQADNAPPEWGQGAEAYGHRFGSNFGIAAITTTTRYTLAEAFRQDTIYYRCECKGFFHRFGHAMVSTLVARAGNDGHRVFSIPALVAPYVGTMSAVYGWYPGRYNAEDAFRLGNYSLLVSAAENVALEFVYGGPHSLLRHMHIKHGSDSANQNR